MLDEKGFFIYIVIGKVIDDSISNPQTFMIYNYVVLSFGLMAYQPLMVI